MILRLVAAFSGSNPSPNNTILTVCFDGFSRYWTSQEC
jgi:hypothetical protein